MPPKRKPNSGPAEVFLSHSSSNGRFAAKVAAVLEAHNVKTFFSKKHIKGAQQWHDELGGALARCDWFVLLLSPQAVKSQWVKRELLYALNHDRYNERIVPLMYRKCEPDTLSWVLESIEFVEFHGSFDAACTRLLKLWGIAYRKTAAAERR